MANTSDLARTIDEVRSALEPSQLVYICVQMEGCKAPIDPHSCLFCKRLDVFSDFRSSEIIAEQALRPDA